MSDPIDESAVALALMREALSLLNTEETAIAADHLRRAIDAVINLPPPTNLGSENTANAMTAKGDLAIAAITPCRVRSASGRVTNSAVGLADVRLRGIHTP